MLNIIHSNIVLKKILKNNLEIKKYLKLINYNKKLQKRLDVNLQDYIDYFLQIKIEIIPIEKKRREETNHILGYYTKYYKIYLFDDKQNKKEIKDSFFSIKKDEDVSKIILILKKEFNIFKGLFSGCFNIREINFIKFNRTDITDISQMFEYCLSLRKINLLKMKTNNVQKMNNLFYCCLELRELDLSNFNTSKVINMESMFTACENLKELILDNFDISNVTNMKSMFAECGDLKYLNIKNFNISQETEIDDMFLTYVGLEKLECPILYIKDNIKNHNLIDDFPPKLKEKIREKIIYVKKNFLTY